MMINMKSLIKYIIIGVITILLLIVLFGSLRTVPTGYVGIKTIFGKVQNDVIQEGLNLKKPFIEKIVKIDCRTKKIETDSGSASKDLQDVALKIVVNYNVNKETANKLYQEVGTTYEDVLVKPAVGPAVTIPTVQLDFLLPKNFELSYIDEDGTKKTPVVIHRAILGSIDRFMAFLLEETKGNLPLWIAPVQVKILPVSNEHHLEYAKKVLDKLLKANIRAELDDREEKVGYRMREAQVKKIPVTLVLGDKEVESTSVNYRLFGSQEQTSVSLDEFIELVNKAIKDKELLKK